MTALSEPVPAARPLKVSLSRDDRLMRAFIAFIALYLVVSLALPLAVMVQKSFSTSVFDLNAYELQVDTGSGWGTSVSAGTLNAASRKPVDTSLSVTGETRLPAADLFPDFSFRSPTQIPHPYRAAGRGVPIRLRAYHGQ